MNVAAKTILVTGAAGFVGARFVESCRARGFATISVDARDHFTARTEHRGVDFGRVVDRDELFAWLARQKPAVAGIVHLGACTDTTELDVAYLDRMNVVYSRQLWEFATTSKIPLVYASSAATYGAGELGYDDDEALISQLRPLNPYGESKRVFDLWALAEETAGRRPPAWSGFKFFNVYGFGERHKEKMSSVVLQATDQIRATGGMKLFRSHNPKYADGGQLRDFVHVDDVVSVLHFALERPLARGIFNLGTGQARTFLDLARGVFGNLGVPERIEFIDTPAVLRERYQYFTEAKMDRLRAAGYTRPFLTLEEGIARYVPALVRSAT